MGEIQKLGKSEREKQVKEVACVVAVKAGKILMGKRADVQKWCMPGGHLEPGEGAQEGAMRELHEEAGLEGKDVTYLGHSFAGRSQNIKVRVFVATVTGEPTAENDPDEEFDEFRWVNPYELPDTVKDNLYNKQDVALQFLGAQEESGKLIWNEEKPLEKMAVGTIPKGQVIGTQKHRDDAEEDDADTSLSPSYSVVGHKIYDYSHHLEPAQREAGLQLHVLDGKTDSRHLLNVRLIHGGKIYGEVEGDIHDKDLGVMYSNVKPEYRHKGLGQKMYEAIYAHGLHHHGVKSVSGGEHSSLAARMHGQLARKHGFKYKSRVNPFADADFVNPGAKEPGEFDGAREGYQYTIKSELVKSDLMSLIARTKALSQHMRELADRGPMSYVFPHPHGGTVVVSPDPSKQGKWRATRIGADHQPTGHIEADDHHGAIRHAHSYGADVMNPVQPAMQKFEEDLGIWLAKATRPENFKAIVRALSNEGRRFVDHTSQLHAHPPKLHPEVEHYNNEVLSSAKIHKPKSGNLKEGITRKLIYHTEHQPSELSSPSPHGHQRSFMVKPYHEGVIKRTHGWAKFPIQGWAEMTNQALYHAAGMGDRHQRVHVAEHNMGPGHEKEPALVVHMEKGMSPIDTHDAENIYVEPGSPMSQEGAKIVAMDFLTNNLDRHAGNLLVSTKKDAGPGEGLPNWVHKEMARTMRYPSWLTDEIGAVNHVDNLMAIDHSRSFQYLNNHAYKWDTPKSVRKRELTDKLRYYFFGTAASRPATARLWEQPRTHEEKIDFIEKVGVPLATWWGDYQDGIREAFYGQLEHIKDPEAKAHLRRNFDARADHLTDLWRQGVENHGVDWFDSEVPIYQPGQKSWREEEEEKNSGEKP